MQPFAHQDIQGWLRPGLYVAASSIQGQGLFTERPIDAGELVVRWGGRILPASTRDAGGVRDHTSVAIAEGVVIAALPDQECSPDDFMNHSCDSNLWMHDALTLCARRRIAAGRVVSLTSPGGSAWRSRRRRWRPGARPGCPARAGASRARPG